MKKLLFIYGQRFHLNGTNNISPTNGALTRVCKQVERDIVRKREINTFPEFWGPFDRHGGASAAGRGKMAAVRLVVWDMAISFLWVLAGALTKLLVFGLLALPRHHPAAEPLKIAIVVSYMFFFAWLSGFTGGGSYNPLSILSSAFTDGPRGFIFTIFVRVPAQVLGSIISVLSIRAIFPQIGNGPKLNVGVQHGALTEGFLTFMIVLISLGLKQKGPKSFFMKTWISSVSKGALYILGSDLTGGVMNPASAFGWAFARGDHIAIEHLLVYWIAPINGTLLAVFLHWLLVREPSKSKAKLE